MNQLALLSITPVYLSNRFNEIELHFNIPSNFEGQQIKEHQYLIVPIEYNYILS